MKKGLRWVRVTNKGGGRGNRVDMCTVYTQYVPDLQGYKFMNNRVTFVD